MLLCRTKSKSGGLIGLDFKTVTYGWFTKVDKIWKEKEVSTVTATHLMEEFICGQLPLTKDTMVALI